LSQKHYSSSLCRITLNVMDVAGGSMSSISPKEGEGFRGVEEERQNHARSRTTIGAKTRIASQY
jgi:hypothetical protein